MNVLAIGASGRLQGNSNSLMRVAVESARTRGAAVEMLYARQLSIQGCLGCDGCKRSLDAACVVQDDIHYIYSRLKLCDVLVLATPVYFYSMNSWLKAIVDRLYGLLGPDYVPRITSGKGFYVITAEEEAGTNAGRDVVATLARALAWLKMDLLGELVAVEVREQNDWRRREDLRSAAENLIAVSNGMLWKDTQPA